MKSQPSQAEIRTVVTAKNTRHYRIVTDDPDNWHLVVNQPISRGEQLTSPDHSHLVDVGEVDFVDVILEETQERKRIYTTISAVPSDSSCVPTTLEIPWCFMNHSCEPNTHDQWKTDVPANLKLAETVATRDIGADEELTFNYNLEHYDYRSPFECQCGVESCSGSIQGFNGLSGKQQEELLPYTSPFVQEKHQRASLPGYIDVSPKGRHVVMLIC